MSALRDFVNDYIDSSSSGSADGADSDGGGGAEGSGGDQGTPSVSVPPPAPSQGGGGGAEGCGRDPNAGQSDQSSPTGTLQVPEITIEGDPMLIDKAAYNAGFNDGKRGLSGKCYADPIADRSYQWGYRDGKAAAEPQSPDYTGPTCGPDDEPWDGPELPEGFDEESPLTRQEYNRYRYLKGTIDEVNRKIAFGLMRGKAWQDSGLRDSDLKEYERLFEIFSPTDPSPTPPPLGSLEQLEQEPDEEELDEGE
jgi:hypothetical protein